MRCKAKAGRPGHLVFESFLIGILLTESQASLSNSLIGDNDTPSHKDLLDITEAQGKAELQGGSLSWPLKPSGLAYSDVRISSWASKLRRRLAREDGNDMVIDPCPGSLLAR